MEGRIQKRLKGVWKEAECLTLCKNSRLVLMSDCHRGCGNWGDNFQANQHLFFAALSYYRDRGFCYIELGDGDELWENRHYKDIITTHSHAFWLMAELYRQNRFYMLYGNHDRKKENRRFLKEQCHCYYCESECRVRELFPDILAREGLVLKTSDGHEILLLHGHQGDLLNDTFWRLTRFLVRYFWRRMELAGFRDPTSAARNYRKKKKIEKRLADFATEEGVLLITGHTHRPVFPKPGEGMYFNDGSCVHPRCITALEIERERIALVKWQVAIREGGSLYVEREVLEGPVRLADYFG